MLDSIIRTYNEDTLNCEKLGLPRSREELLEKSRYATPGSRALRYPDDSENIGIIGQVEEIRNPDILFNLLNYFDDIGAIEVDEHGWTVSSATKLIREDILASEWSYDSACIARHTSSFNLSRRILLKLVEMALKHREPLISRVASNIPDSMNNLFSHRMARELFSNRNNFSPERSNQILLELNDEQKWEIFAELIHFASVNDTYLDAVKQVHHESDDEIILEGLRRVIAHCESMPDF